MSENNKFPKTIEFLIGQGIPPYAVSESGFDIHGYTTFNYRPDGRKVVENGEVLTNKIPWKNTDEAIRAMTAYREDLYG